MIINCKVCNKEVKVSGKRINTAKYCGYKCMGTDLKKKPNKACNECGKPIFRKNHRLKKHGNFFCNVACMALWKSKNSFGTNNPNFRNKMYDYDGYRIIHSEKIGRISVHKLVTFEILNINNIPKGHHIHHRDCNHLNNDPNNLVILTLSDHRWLHAQFGSAVLWAFCNNKIDLETLISWSNDKERAQKLLPLTIYNQIGVFKSDELLENPEMKLDEK